LNQNGWSNMDLTDRIVIGVLNACHADKSEDQEIREIFQSHRHSLSIEEKEDEGKSERGKGQPDMNQFSRGYPDVEERFGHRPGDTPECRADQDICITAKFIHIHDHSSCHRTPEKINGLKELALDGAKRGPAFAERGRPSSITSWG